MEVYDNRSLKYHKRYETKDRQLIQFEIDESQSRDNFSIEQQRKKNQEYVFVFVFCLEIREREREREIRDFLSR